MDDFFEKFGEFKEFLNSKATEHLLASLTRDGGMTLKVIRDKFDELGLNKAL